MKKLLLLIPLLALFISCDNWVGCGPITYFNSPEPQYETDYVNGYRYRIQTGERYSVTVLGDDGKEHKVYCSYDTWQHGRKGDIVCVE